MNIVVVGTGYVGLVTAVCLAEKGHFVICVDNDEEKIKILQKGKIPIYEPMLESLMLKNKERIIYTSSSSNVYKNASIIFIGVGTPEKYDGSVNLEYVYNVANEIAINAENDLLVVLKSTVPIGTNDKIEKYIKDNLKNKINVETVSNPEFLSQGTAINDTLNAQRIVLGVKTEHAKNIMEEIYDRYNRPYVITDRKSAEMIKYASNDFLALKISYINEIANLCEIVGANIEDVTKGMGADKRIGDKFLNAGIGYGGSCFPKDTKALHWLAEINDYELKTVKATIEVNKMQRLKLIKKAKKYYKTFEGISVTILGATFKPNTDDLRESPVLDNIPILLEGGAKIKIYDPVGEKKLKKIFSNKIEYFKEIEDALKEADVCLIFTEWKEIKEMDLNMYVKQMNTPIVIDGRNCYNPNDIPKGLIYESIGRKTV